MPHGKLNGHPRCSLFLRTLELLRSRSRLLTLEIIADDTHLPREWLSSVLKHPEMSPSVDRIQILYEYLTNSKLNV